MYGGVAVLALESLYPEASRLLLQHQHRDCVVGGVLVDRRRRTVRSLAEDAAYAIDEHRARVLGHVAQDSVNRNN